MEDGHHFFVLMINSPPIMDADPEIQVSLLITYRNFLVSIKVVRLLLSLGILFKINSRGEWLVLT